MVANTGGLSPLKMRDYDVELPASMPCGLEMVEQSGCMWLRPVFASQMQLHPKYITVHDVHDVHVHASFTLSPCLRLFFGTKSPEFGFLWTDGVGDPCMLRDRLHKERSFEDRDFWKSWSLWALGQEAGKPRWSKNVAVLFHMQPMQPIILDSDVMQEMVTGMVGCLKGSPILIPSRSANNFGILLVVCLGGWWWRFLCFDVPSQTNHTGRELLRFSPTNRLVSPPASREKHIHLISISTANSLMTILTPGMCPCRVMNVKICEHAYN